MIRIVLSLIQLFCSAGYLLATVANKDWNNLLVPFCWWVGCIQLCFGSFIDEWPKTKKEPSL